MKRLSAYLGMIPAAISIVPGSDEAFTAKLRDFLCEIGYEQALSADIDATTGF